MKRIVSFFAVLVGAGRRARPRSAQVQTGSILVKATDDQGGVVPGVTVTISSPVLVAGSMTGVTDGGGVNRFPSLVPGTYTVKLELAGFQTITRENIVVLVGQTVPVDFSMKLASLAENITVTGASPTVDTTSANVAVNLSEQLIQGTPGGRDIWALVEAKVPGLVISRPDVGGTSGGLQGTFSARGTASAQNTSFLNGVNVGDPAAIGAAGFYYDFDAFDDIQVSTGAHDITVPTSGVFLNMVTKTGGNKWNGSTTFTWTGDSLQGRNDTIRRSRATGFRPDGNTSDFVSDINVTAGGPLVQNKLRFFGSFRDWRVHQNVPVQNSQSVLDQTNITSGLGNVTWQMNQNNQLTGFYSRQRYSKPNRLLNAAVDHRRRFDRRRRRHVRHRPGTVEHDPRQEPLHRRPPRAEQDSVPDLLQRRQPAVGDRQRHRDHLRQQPERGDPQPRPLPVERDRRSTTSIGRSAAGTRSGSASTTRTRSPRTRRTASTTCGRSTTARRHRDPRPSKSTRRR